MEPSESNIQSSIDLFLNEISLETALVLPAKLLARYKNRAVLHGKRIVLEVSGERYAFHVLFCEKKLTKPPLLALESPPAFLKWPHVEQDGMICLLNEHDSTDIESPIAVLSYLIDEAVQLVSKCLSGNIREDFELEANTYWSYLDKGKYKNIFCLIELEHTSDSTIYYWESNQKIVLSDDLNKLNNWVKNFFMSDKDLLFCRALHIQLERPLIPTEFPITGRDVFQLIEHQNLDLATNIENFLNEELTDLPILLSAPTKDGYFVGAVIIRKQSATLQKNGVHKGFRKGKAPKKIIKGALFSNNNVIHKSVHLITHSWIHGRNQDNQSSRLNDKLVTIAGCGSIGSFVANTLAMSGIGKFIFIDKDILHSANLSRHILGAQYLLNSKALSLSEHLSKNLPHIENVYAFPKPIESLSMDEIERVANSDLVISLMGDIHSELYLDQKLRSENSKCPVLYGWMEPFACAHHALYIQPQGPCLNCQLDQYGNPKFIATVPPENFILPKEPACGTSFMPYSNIAAQNAATLIAEFAIEILLGREIHHNHRIKIESELTLKNNGVNKSDEWLDVVDNQNITSLARKWDMNTSCKGKHG